MEATIACTVVLYVATKAEISDGGNPGRGCQSRAIHTTMAKTFHERASLKVDRAARYCLPSDKADSTVCKR
jgi:hypothetical protein